MITVPNVHEMEDEIFKKHANKRHVGKDHDFMSPFTNHDQSEAVLDSARWAHEFWHREHQEQYDHYHIPLEGEDGE